MFETEEPVAPEFPSDETLLSLNEAIASALLKYLPEGVMVRFDLPDADEVPSDPTVSVFLYDLQEDLQLRHGEQRVFDYTTKKLLPGYVQVRCCYLITYWDSMISSSGDSPSSGPRSQSMTMMNQVLNALLNSRSLDGMATTYSRIIPPSEHLNSLGNFWQSLGNKPRLSLSYAVTVPIQLLDKNEDRSKVETTEAVLQQGLELPESPVDVTVQNAAKRAVKKK